MLLNHNAFPPPPPIPSAQNPEDLVAIMNWPLDWPEEDSGQGVWENIMIQPMMSMSVLD